MRRRDDASGDEGGGASVSVVLSDPFGPAFTPGQFAVEPDPISVDAGSVEIVAKNQGADTHELVIVKGDDPALLPVDEYGGVIEDDLPEDDLIGEIPWSFPGPKSRRRSISMPGATSSSATSSRHKPLRGWHGQHPHGDLTTNLTG